MANETRYLRKQKEDLKNDIDKIKRDKEIIKNRMSGGGAGLTTSSNAPHPPTRGGNNHPRGYRSGHNNH